MTIGKKGPFSIHSSQVSDNEYSDDRYSLRRDTAIWNLLYIVKCQQLNNCLYFYYIDENLNHHNSPFVLISIAFILSHISQCSGQQS